MKNFRTAVITLALVFFHFFAIPIAQATVTATKIAEADYPVGFAEDLAGNIYVADDNLGLVVVPAASGTLFGQSVTAGLEHTLAAASGIRGIAVNATGTVVYSLSNGDVYALSSMNSNLFGESLIANTPKKIKSATGLQGGMDFDSDGNLYGVNLSSGEFSVLPMSSGTLFGVAVAANTSAVLYSGPDSWFWDLAVDGSGNIFVSDGFGLQGVFVLPKNTGTIYGQAVTAEVFTRISTFSTAIYSGIDIDSNDVLYVNIYGDRTMAVSPTSRKVFETDLTANTVAPLTGTSGQVLQGILALQNGNLISGAFTGAFRLVATPTVTVPNAPTIGIATALSSTSASISFVAPANNGGATIQSYTVTSSPGGITNQILQAASGSITITGLTSSTSYTFRITASNSVGTSLASSASASITTPASQVEIDLAALAAQKVAAAQREAAKELARSEISNKIKSSDKVTVEIFQQAEIAGITEENIEAIQAEIAALSEGLRADIARVLKIARKYEVVGMLASDRVVAVYSNSLIEIGLIPEESEYKATLTRLVKELSQDERSSYASIKEAIEAEMAVKQAREDRLTNILALIASRRNG